MTDKEKQALIAGLANRKLVVEGDDPYGVNDPPDYLNNLTALLHAAAKLPDGYHLALHVGNPSLAAVLDRNGREGEWHTDAEPTRACFDALGEHLAQKK